MVAVRATLDFGAAAAVGTILSFGTVAAFGSASHFLAPGALYWCLLLQGFVGLFSLVSGTARLALLESP